MRSTLCVVVYSDCCAGIAVSLPGPGRNWLPSSGSLDQKHSYKLDNTSVNKHLKKCTLQIAFAITGRSSNISILKSVKMSKAMEFYLKFCSVIGSPNNSRVISYRSRFPELVYVVHDGGTLYFTEWCIGVSSSRDAVSS